MKEILQGVITRFTRRPAEKSPTIIDFSKKRNFSDEEIALMVSSTDLSARALGLVRLHEMNNKQRGKK